MLKNTFWNHLFHKNELEKQKEKYHEALKLRGLGPETLQFVDQAKSLGDLLEVHKIAWKRGYQTEGLAPCEYGIFRTDAIETMKPGEVFLGNIYGLWTFPIPKWEERRDAKYGVNGYGIDEEKLVYDIIFDQYKTLLKRNIRYAISDAEGYIEDYEYNNRIS